ncbi:hypothetical protein B5X24_HaOG202785 [Helicoverpa armigera]|uniref:Uncharacterized protein n=1 Tax=Helicoverpa armigera TaxID=29058 RepID=A0A2W1BWB3_HELAM|nr:hypothetical protein B5X24_HaOG202785 [Helicoverpa armigera]
MNTFTFFALVICAIFAMVSAVPQPDAEIINGAGPVPAELFEGAESRGYNRHGGGGHGHYGHDHHHGHGHHGHGR